MSYPRAIQPLVIEDEQRAKTYYEEVFRQLNDDHSILPPKFAFCQSDARELLSQDQVFQLVILDLRLPEEPDQPAAASLDLGLDLLQVCLNRNDFPIPAMLVISGNLKEVDQGQLENQVRDGFAYGRVLVKSERLDSVIKEAITHCQKLCDVGIHLRDSEDKTFPTISPREGELLRRCILSQDCLGIDIGWWSIDYSPLDGWTKVLMGRFVLAEGRGNSIYSFFKLASSDGANSVIREAEVMNQKLSHVNVVYSEIAGNRSLLVTQAVGKGKIPPLSLNDAFQRPATAVGIALDNAAKTVAEQVASLGDHSPDQHSVSQLLWDHHDIGQIQEQWDRRRGSEILQVVKEFGIECTDPVAVFRHIRESTHTVRYERQSCRHGDLNYTNIALEESTEDSIEAFIFDASGCKPGASLRDLAMLEVTTLLHQTPVDGHSIVRRAVSLFAEIGEVEENDNEKLSHQVANTVRFIRALRNEAQQRDSQNTYSLLVFDNAMMQLGGLGFGSSFNKIHDPQDAALLVALSCHWLTQVAPELFDV